MIEAPSPPLARSQAFSGNYKNVYRPTRISNLLKGNGRYCQEITQKLPFFLFFFGNTQFQTHREGLL